MFFAVDSNHDEVMMRTLGSCYALNCPAISVAEEGPI